METPVTQRNVTPGQIVVAVALLVGILLVCYGYFERTRIEFYVGVAVTAASVVVGVVQLLMRRQEVEK